MKVMESWKITLSKHSEESGGSLSNFTFHVHQVVWCYRKTKNGKEKTYFKAHITDVWDNAVAVTEISSTAVDETSSDKSVINENKEVVVVVVVARATTVLKAIPRDCSFHGTLETAMLLRKLLQVNRNEQMQKIPKRMANNMLKSRPKVSMKSSMANGKVQKLTKTRKPNNSAKPVNKFKATAVLPYVKGLSEQLRCCLQGARTVLKSETMPRSQLVQPKDTVDPAKQDGVVYRIPI
ncbi:hypothetical protein pdam_00001624 [Pocillopora damicornis]|uniref:Uncharacterized protein n=1 Tax=Pocillopora damicornis TaxID=46731 RepID=A0A3M6U5C9_POCDA|nr:hypothetical protein pdam_00001624 [Pocillopora damicornis]